MTISSLASATPILGNLFTCGTFTNQFIALLEPNQGHAYLIDRHNLDVLSNLRCSFISFGRQTCFDSKNQNTNPSEARYFAEIEYKTLFTPASSSNIPQKNEDTNLRTIQLKLYKTSSGQEDSNKTLVDVLACEGAKHVWPSLP